MPLYSLSVTLPHCCALRHAYTSYHNSASVFPVLTATSNVTLPTTRIIVAKFPIHTAKIGRKQRTMESLEAANSKPILHHQQGSSGQLEGYTIPVSVTDDKYPTQVSLDVNHSLSSKQKPSLLVFSGGTAFNGLVEELKNLTTAVAHVLPVSDDGGSTAEIVRVLGGPAIGDIRSRCLRLSDSSSAEARAVHALLAHRLPLDASLAKSEWLSIVEGEHKLWADVSEPYKETIRAFLVHFQHQLLQHASEKFQFQNGSVGNFFFAGARIFFRSLDAAIFLFSRVSHIPPDSLVLPCICTNDRLTLGAELTDGTIIRGQHEISHPAVDSLPGQPVTVNKECSTPLPAPIQRLFYISSEGSNFMHEVFPQVNPRVLDHILTVDALIYGVGSLYTSVCPSLVLRGVGEAIASRKCPKVLMLNGMYDRETAGMTASDFVLAVTNSLNRTHGDLSANKLRLKPSDFVTALLAPKGGQVPVDRDRLACMGVMTVIMVESVVSPRGGCLFDDKALIHSLRKLIDKIG